MLKKLNSIAFRRCAATLKSRGVVIISGVKEMKAQEKKDRQLKEQILAIYKKHNKHYGSPRICDELHDMGIRCSKKRIERLMQELGIKARFKRQFRITTNSNHNYPVATNLLNRQFQVDAPNRVWVADITYIVLLKADYTWLRSWICSLEKSLDGLCQILSIPNCQLLH